MRLIVFGQHGSGKGEQCSLISKHYKIPHISTGALFRTEIAKATKLGRKVESLEKGGYAPDEITDSLIEKRLAKKDCKKGFILDDYPATLSQAYFLENLLKRKKWKIDALVLLKVPKEKLIRRIINRRTCLKCSAEFNLISDPPKKDENCDFCKDKLVHREVDKPFALKKRMEFY